MAANKTIENNIQRQDLLVWLHVPMFPILLLDVLVLQQSKLAKSKLDYRAIHKKNTTLKLNSKNTNNNEKKKYHLSNMS
jgi:hypothetical protein